MKATEQHFLVVLFIMLYNYKVSSVTIQMKTTEQYFPVEVFIALYKAVLASRKCHSDHSSF